MLVTDIKNITKVDKFINLKKNVKFNKISSNSKLINEKTIFIVDSKKKIKLEYLEEAKKRKVPAIISDKVYKKVNSTQLIVKDLNKAIEKLLYELKPNKPVKSIAITGTNGKTSVVWYISQLCKINNINIKTQGTLGHFINGKKINENINTTPDFVELHQNAYSKKKNKYNFVFEASSHALDQERIKNFPVNLAAITNITRDHIDYHKSFKKYKFSKFKLFSKYLEKSGTAILNSRLKNNKKLVDILKKRKIKIIFYGKKNIFFKKKSNNIISLNIYNKKYNLQNLKFNEIEKQNLECAIACCLEIGIKNSQIVKNLIKITSPPGRLEVINYKKKSSKIIIDYAHTPDALKNILKCFTLNNKKPSLVFGCGGERDKGKRKKMGKIALDFARDVFITDDNPRNENPKNIRAELIKYCPKAKEISDRKKAIHQAIKNMKKNTVLIIAGKGHEKVQIIKNKIKLFDDFKIAKEIIKKN